jgi:hypothetical protein
MADYQLLVKVLAVFSDKPFCLVLCNLFELNKFI